MKITIYQITDGLINPRNETWNSITEAYKHYGTMPAYNIQLRGWAHDTALLVSGTDTNGVAISV